MTAQNILEAVIENIEGLQKKQRDLREKTYTGFELVNHAQDARELFEINGAIRALQDLKLTILMSKEK